MKPPDWFPNWAGETAIVVASGPSAAEQPLALAKGKARFIVVNTSWKLAPWADILYAGDFPWWRAYDGCPEFQGLKITIDRRASDRQEHPDWNVVHLRCEKNTDELLLNPKGLIGWGMNSGFGAVNIAAQLDVKNIILVGYDMSLHAGSHWHGVHLPRMGNPRESQLPRWRRAMERAAPILEAKGISVYNTSQLSALRKFRKTTFAEALGECLGLDSSSDDASHGFDSSVD